MSVNITVATSAACSEPAASMTARTSSIRVSSVGAPTTWSDMPVPRLSKWIGRENDASCSKKARAFGTSQPSSTFETAGGTNTTSNGPSPTT
jgi:hypothetical protein